MRFIILGWLKPTFQRMCWSILGLSNEQTKTVAYPTIGDAGERWNPYSGGDGVGGRMTLNGDVTNGGVLAAGDDLHITNLDNQGVDLWPPMMWIPTTKRLFEKKGI